MTSIVQVRCEALAARIEELREQFSQGTEIAVDDTLRYRFELVHDPSDQPVQPARPL